MTMKENHDMPIEIERKFLVLNDLYKEKAFGHSHIRQGYLCSNDGRTVRVRIRDHRAYLTIKGPTPEGGLPCYEFEKEITLEEGKQLMLLCEPGIIEKERWLVNSGKHIFEVDEFFGENEGLVMAEVELSSENESVIIPDFIGKEVTGDQRYFNSQLRLSPMGGSKKSSYWLTPEEIEELRQSGFKSDIKAEELWKKKVKHPLIQDIPFPLQEVMRMYWLTEEATAEEANLPEADQVQAFVRWCKILGNVKNLDKENLKFLEEN